MLGREGDRVHDGLILDGCQPAQSGLSTTQVVRPFDPGDDRDSEFLSGLPPSAVQDVRLEQGEEGFHRGVVAGGTDLAHRSDEVMTVQCVDELP